MGWLVVPALLRCDICGLGCAQAVEPRPGSGGQLQPISQPIGTGIERSAALPGQAHRQHHDRPGACRVQSMPSTITAGRPAHPLEAGLALALAALAALRVLLVAAIALALTLAGTAPATAPAIDRPAAIDKPAPAPRAALPVREVRHLARAAGHRQLARSGRKAELLLALAA